MIPPLNALEHEYLHACHVLVQAELELVPLLANTLGVQPGEVFSYWMDREFPRVVIPPDEEWRLQVGQVEGTHWGYFFHGFECELHHKDDGRHVRVEFGPHGRYDLVSDYAVLHLIMTSRAPWPEFTELKDHLAKKPAPYDCYSGCEQKSDEIWKHLEAHGLFEEADPALADIVRRGTVRLPSGSYQISLPQEFTEQQHLDSMVCNRRVLSAKAKQLLGELSCGSPETLT